LTVPDIKDVKRVNSTQDIHHLNSGPKVMENDFFPNNYFGVGSRTRGDARIQVQRSKFGKVKKDIFLEISYATGSGVEWSQREDGTPHYVV
jgi:hypothetical protein